MKRVLFRVSSALLASLLLTTISVHAQDDKDKEKDKEKADHKGEQIIITKKGNSNDKVVVEIDGDKVKVNGKPIEDLKNEDISVNVHQLRNNQDYAFNWNGNHDYLVNVDNNRAMLGVVTDKVDEGVEITDITDGSGAEKAGLKEDDIITKVDDKKVEDPDDLTKIIRDHKPGDKVTITYLRDKKESRATAELSKWKGSGFSAMTTMPDMERNMVAPKLGTTPKFRFSPGQYYAFGADRPRLGLSVQDTEDGKGVKVVDVDEEGSAKKAGVKEDDIILSVNDKDVNSADEVAKIVRDNKEKSSVMLKVKRDNKTQNIEVHIPRKLKTADL
ncbi:MAG TPA: PDZ domain-containing protein [Chitinophagaceae bacterium]